MYIMKILVINSGSSSLKSQLVDTENNKVVCKVTFDAIGLDRSFYEFEQNGIETKKNEPIKSHEEAVKKLFELLGNETKQICGIGHRVVHGGEKYQKSVIATDEVLQGVEAVSHFAPLHNPKNLLGVRACMKIMPGVPNVLVFDTAFHSTLPQSSFHYATTHEDYEKHGIRRFGFHGTSYAYVSRKVAEMMGKPIEDLKMVIGHLGNGASICAIDGGKSVQTSMGLTPLEGVMMGTRSGDIDPAAAIAIGRARGLDYDGLLHYLNNECGLKGVSGVTSDIRDVVASKKKNPRAKLAYDIFVGRITKYYGAYIATLGGVDAIVYTAGIGTNQACIREAIADKLGFMGAKIDKKLNKSLGRNPTIEISRKGAKIRTFVVCTNEELEIAIETKKLVK